MRIIILKKYREGNFEDAADLFTKEIEVNPINEDAYYERGNSKYALLDYYGALQDLDKAIELKPHPAFFCSRSATNSRLGNYQGAIEDASKAIESKENYADAFINRATAYSMLNQNNKAVDDYSSIIAFQPDHILALLNRGVAYQKLNKMDKACEDWGVVADTGEKNSSSLYSRYCK